MSEKGTKSETSATALQSAIQRSGCFACVKKQRSSIEKLKLEQAELARLNGEVKHMQDWI
jgi:hypothetical protein